MKKNNALAVIGAGPAGLTAAVYGIRAGLAVTVFEGNAPGGQMLLTHEIENYAGFANVSGMDLADAMTNQAMSLGAEIAFGAVSQVEQTENGFCLHTPTERRTFDAVIVAAGTNQRKLGVPGEAEFTGRGVSYCAVCDGRFFKDKSVAVVGGGNTAVGDALYLSKICKSVTLIHRRDAFRADHILVERLRECENVHLLLNTRVEKIGGQMRVESLDLVSTSPDALSERSELPVDGVFVAVGNAPILPFLSELNTLQRDEAGYIVTDERCRTSIPGLFAAGDVRKKPLRQIATAVADGAVAAVEAAEYLQSLPQPQRVGDFR